MDGAERGYRAPIARRKSDRCARSAVGERMDEVVGDPLKTIDLAPGSAPRTKVSGQPIRRCRKRREKLIAGRSGCSILVRRNAGSSRSLSKPPLQVLSPVNGKRRRHGIDAPPKVPFSKCVDLFG